MVVLFRSIAPLLRTTRITVRQQKGVNPIQQVFGRDANGTRGLATVFERSKPHVNIGMEYEISNDYLTTADLGRNYWSR